MYKKKPTFDCDMPNCKPTPDGLNVLVLNASLKHKDEISNTEEVAQLVIDEMKKIHGDKVSTEIVRLADKNIPVGLKFKENDQDEWPELAIKLREADIIIFAT